MKTPFFSVLICNHRLFGNLFQPFMLTKERDTQYTIQELVSPKNLLHHTLSEQEKKIVTLCHKCSEPNLMKLFVKEKITIAQFQKRYEKNREEYAHIPPYIDRYNYQVARALMSSGIAVFHRKDSYRHVYDADSVFVFPDFATHVAFFERTAESLFYSLQIYQWEERIPLVGCSPVILSHSPCSMLLNNKLLVFEKLEASRLTPFMKKEHIVVPKKSEAVYMKSFVLNTLKQEQVESKGFEIIREQFEPVPVLTVKEGFSTNVAVQLSFRYGEKLFSIEVLNIRCVSLQERDGNYTFHVFDRDVEKEKRYARLLESVGFMPYNLLFQLKEKSETPLYSIIETLKEQRELLCAFELKSEFDDKQYSFEKISLTADFSVERDWFDIHGSVQIGSFNIPFTRFRRYILSRTREYVLPDKTVAILPLEWFTRFSEIFRFSHEQDGAIRLKKCYTGIIDVFGEEKAAYLVFNDKIEKEVPAGINAQLRAYQKTGFSWLAYLYENSFGGCLADDMGLGKTLQFLTFFQYVYRDKKAASLIVLPTSLLHHWKNEAEKFAPRLLVYLYSGNRRIRSRDIGKIFDHYNLILTTYGVMRNDIDYLTQYQFDSVVLDESQYIKNSSSQVYHCVTELKANHFFVMTGTPIENSLEDLWSQLNFVNRDMLGSHSHFKTHFVQPIVEEKDEEMEKRLKKIIKPFILRRTKGEVAVDLPPVIEQMVYCEMSEEQQRVYVSEKSVVRNNLFERITQSGLAKNTILAITALLRLRQLANHPGMVLDTYSGDSAKIEEVVSRIESLRAEHHKVLIFSSFVKLLQLVEARLQRLDIEYAMLTGETIQREEVVRRFQEHRSVGCFLISLKAGGVGLNLTAADYVFILDPWWNPAAEWQAINRAHRIGQDKTVMVYRFITLETIEEKIQNLQSEKSKLANTYINTNNPFADLELSDVEGLFT